MNTNETFKSVFDYAKTEESIIGKKTFDAIDTGRIFPSIDIVGGVYVLSLDPSIRFYMHKSEYIQVRNHVRTIYARVFNIEPSCIQVKEYCEGY